MKQFRIKPLHVLAAGLVLSVAVAVLFFFMFAKPLLKQQGSLAKQIDAQQQIADGKKAAEKKKAAAEAMKAIVDARYDQVMKARMPVIPYRDDPLASRIYMWGFADKEFQVIDRWFRSTGAQVSGYSFQPWGMAIPNLKVPALDPVTWNLTVTVKNYADLQRWLLLLPKAPRLMLLNSVNIPAARAPGEPLTANVSVTLYEWVDGPAAPAPAAAAGGAAGGGGAGGGAGAGGPGGGGMGRGGGGMGRGGGGMGRGGGGMGRGGGGG